MYINKIVCENVGPIESISIKPRFNSAGNPIPIVIVGENGSGKSILLSQIVDALYELADVGYENATQKTSAGHEYYRTIVPDQIRLNSSYMATVLSFSSPDKPIYYYCKSGNLNINDFFDKHGIPDKIDIKRLEAGNDKKVVITEKQSEDIFSHNVLCYFPPSRYEKPRWLGKDYFEEMGLSHEEYMARRLRNPIIVNNVTVDTLQWLFNIIADSRCDLGMVVDNGKISYQIAYPPQEAIMSLMLSRSNVERVLGEILGKDVLLRMQNRSFSGSKRIGICDTKGNLIIPTLDSLSTGQMALFSIFSTIVRYADRINVNQSIRLESIRGIVVIDEIDLHLHSNLQRNALGELLKLFPKVQFIITTHSPLALLGLNQTFGDDLDIIEMPSGKYISAEEFAEFDKAYSFYKETDRYTKEIREAIDQQTTDKPLIITEGATDWRHFEAAYNALKTRPENAWLNELDFEFLEYDPKNSKDENPVKIDMGQEIKNMPKEYGKIEQKRKMIFVADNDVPDICKCFMVSGKEYKNWGNNVYSMTLPVPSHRKSNEAICVEHLYLDDDLMQWVIVDGHKRRIFLGNEFSELGFYQKGDEKYFCGDRNACGKDKISVIDGCDNKKVFIPFGDEKENFALPKMQFAKMVLAAEKPFDNMNFDGFLPLFERLKRILDEENTN